MLGGYIHCFNITEVLGNGCYEPLQSWKAEVLKRLMITTGKYIDGAIASDMQQTLQFSKEHILNERKQDSDTSQDVRRWRI
jgi:hypothetical protein